jgi:hypothetical protein
MGVVAGRGGVGLGSGGEATLEEEELEQLVRRKLAPGAAERGGAQLRSSRVAAALALAVVALLGAGLLAGPWSDARRASGDAELESLAAAVAASSSSEGPHGETPWPKSPNVVPASAGQSELNAEAEHEQQPEEQEQEQKQEQEQEQATLQQEHDEEKSGQFHEFPATRPRMKLERGRGSVLASCVHKYGAPAQELIDPAQFNPPWPPQEPRPNTTVFVYEAPEVNWLKQMQLTCPEANLRKMLSRGGKFQHSADLRTALALLEGNGARSFIESGRRTYDPLAADVIVVPVLLSMMGYREHPRFFEGCAANSSRNWTETAARYLEAQPHYHATAHKHFFVADWYVLNGTNFHDRLVAAMRRGVVATFEGRPRAFAGACTVIPPYVPAQCVGPTAEPSDLPRNASVRDAWFFGGSYFERPIEFYLRAMMDKHRGHKKERIGLCHAVHQFDKRSGAFSTCCSTPGDDKGLTRKYSGLVYDHKCSSGIMTACNCHRTTSGWCKEIRKARFLLYAPGDTPVSRRAYDAMRYGTVMVVLKRHGDRDYTRYMPRRVPWSHITLEVEGVSYRNVKDMVGGFFTAANVTVDEILCRRKLANDYAAVTDMLAYDGVPAVQWMLESARRDCIEPKAAASTHIGR